MRSNSPPSLRWIHYSTPLGVVLFTVILSIASACVTRPSGRTVLLRSQRTLSKWVALAVAMLYFSEGLVHILRARLQEWVGQDTIVYVTLSTLVWYGYFNHLDDATTVYWLPMLASWILATTLEITICFLFFHSPSTKNHFTSAKMTIQLLRILCLVCLCGSVTVIPNPVAEIDVERQSLLGPGENTPVKSAQYGAIQKTGTVINDEETDEDDHSKKLQQEQHQRLEKLDGWWAYLKQFRIFLPHLIPTGSLRLKSYAVCVAVFILGDRFSNVIGPHLLGDIVNRIALMEDKDDIPWRQILFFILVIKIPHDQILVPLRSSCSTRLLYESYRGLMLSSFAHIMGLSLEYHENKSTGEVEIAMRQGQSLSRIFDDLMNTALPLLLDVGIALIYLSWLFSISLGLVLTVVYALYIIVTYKITAWSTERRRRYLQAQTEEQALINQSIANWQTAVYFNRQEYLQRRMEEVVGREVRDMARFNDISHVKNIAQGLVMTLGYGAVLLLAAHQSKSEKQPVGSMVTLLLYWNIITKPLFSLTTSYKDFVNYLIDAEQLLQIRKMTATVTDVEGARDLEFKGGKIEYRNVHFSYDKENSLIKGLNFTVEPGSTIAFVGATGSGKTTTCDKLLFRLYDVTEGSILIDDQDVRDVTQFSLRETMGIVRQDQTFYNETIMENVRFARLDATDEEVYVACKNAVIHEKILTFPNGYNSKIGERGVKLSGGEKQRLFIAQLFLRDPKIVVLDEATSTVDNVTENEIQDSFARICEGRTTVIIAHRLSTVMDADQIFVLDQGQIAERGTHSELLDMRGKYYDLWATKKRVERLHKVLARGTSGIIEGGNEPPVSTSALVDTNDSTDSVSTSIASILQVDGGTGSKHMEGSNPARTGIRKKIRNVKERFSNQKPNEEETFDIEYDDQADNTSPIRPISPSPTDVSIVGPKARRSFSFRRRSRDVAMPGSVSTAKPFYASVLEQEQRVFSPEPTQSGIQVQVDSFSSPGSPREESAFGTSSTTSALFNHPAGREDEDHEGAGACSTYVTPGSSTGNKRDENDDEH
ncbi:hypothetical protein K505DRAFT_327037 [Melanomma pulvis-pyrius CBS 109.77]|uniref:Heavy metal tolerance protein n=1 Tax=Melanomma pulvis-pyrius CBS 109.77 TaxID=1314802 RepID=A0A6A6X4H6_9PLEO|nr:hypothetical protein K505DRAFT_327037 [Melanomma pulvis-pyrius CBS 109.77]